MLASHLDIDFIQLSDQDPGINALSFRIQRLIKSLAPDPSNKLQATILVNNDSSFTNSEISSMKQRLRIYLSNDGYKFIGY